jgi:hypothetical protein
LSNTFKVNHKDIVVNLGNRRDKLNGDFRFFVLLKHSSLVHDAEFVLEVSTVSWYAHTVVNVHFRRVGKVEGLLHWEFVGDLTEVNYVFRETECGCHDMTLESEGKHLRASFKSESEGLREFSENIRLEAYDNRIFLVGLDPKGSLSLAEAKLGSKWGVKWNELPVAVDLAGVLDNEFLFALICDENIANIHFCD